MLALCWLRVGSVLALCWLCAGLGVAPLPANVTAVAMPQACQTRVKMHGPSTRPSKTQCVSLNSDLNSHSVAEW